MINNAIIFYFDKEVLNYRHYYYKADNLIPLFPLI
jgi:hypothetical protein